MGPGSQNGPVGRMEGAEEREWCWRPAVVLGMLALMWVWGGGVGGAVAKASAEGATRVIGVWGAAAGPAEKARDHTRLTSVELGGSHTELLVRA